MQSSHSSEEPSKECKDCRNELPLTQFWRMDASPDGYAYYCKPCFRQRGRLSRQRRAGDRQLATLRQRGDGPAGTKWCPGCLSFLPLDAFVRNRSTPDGIGSYCRPCQNAKAEESRLRVHGGSRHYHLMRRYGIGAAEVDALLEAQFGACPLCLRPLTAKDAHVDHDHVTGAVRAVLCFNCNGGLGQFRDQPDALRRAAAYLEGDVWRPTGTDPGDSPVPS